MEDNLSVPNADATLGRDTNRATPVAVPERRPWNRALVVMFVSVLIGANLDLAFGLDPNPNPLREVVPFPAPHLDRSLLRWPGRLRWYLQSSMGFRGTLVRAHGLLAWHWLRVSPAPESVVRADPWLFQRSERVLDDFRHTDPFSRADLERWRASLEARRSWAASHGARYLVVIAPNKETIYAGALPAWATRAPNPSRLSQLAAYLRASSDLEILDLTGALERERDRDARVYYFTDTHWNDQGAFAGYRALAARLSSWFPALRPATATDFSAVEQLVPGGDLARICGLRADLLEPQIQLRLRPGMDSASADDGTPISFERMDVRGKQRFRAQSPKGEIDSAVVLRDSFGEGLIPFLARHFRTSTWIWTYDFPESVVAELHPAVVIQELAERKLMTIDPDNPDGLALDR